MSTGTPESAAAGGDAIRESRERCWTCWRPRLVCLCPVIEPFETRTHFVLLMHPREAKRQRLGTGRLTRACLPRTEICVGVDFSGDERVERLIRDDRYDPYLLYPGGALLGGSVLSGPRERPIRLFLLDGTWPQAKVMVKRSHNLSRLSRLSIDPAAPSRFTIKQQPGELCLSTIESVHRWISEANRVGLEATAKRHEVLLTVLDELCRQQIECAQDPHRSGYRRQPYKTAEERPKAKKWQQRKFFLG